MAYSSLHIRSDEFRDILNALKSKPVVRGKRTKRAKIEAATKALRACVINRTVRRSGNWCAYQLVVSGEVLDLHAGEPTERLRELVSKNWA